MDQEPDKFSKPLDFFVIDKFFDPLTQKIQRNIGLDCFFWATTLLLICIPVLIFNLMILIPMMFKDVLVFFTTIITFVFLIHEGHKLRCKDCGISAIRKLAYKEVQGGKRNSLIFKDFRWYLAFLFWAMTIFLDLREGLRVFLLLMTLVKIPFMAHYIFQCLISCTPLPPRKSKLRKALENLKEKMAEVMGGNPLPEPA